MGSQTSTDKFGDEGNKNFMTNQSINETFELGNIIGSASIDAPAKGQNRSININLTRLSAQQDKQAPKTTQ